MKNIMRWQVEILSPPAAMRYCKKCGVKREHISSGLFRVNANAKSLDIWLIYHCVCCGTRWKSTIFTRVTPSSLGDKTLRKFTNNDFELAMKYAMDVALIQKNGSVPGKPKYSVTGEKIYPAGLTAKTELQIECRYDTKIKLSGIIKEKCALSNSEFKRLAANGTLYMKDGSAIGRVYLQKKQIVVINPA